MLTVAGIIGGIVVKEVHHRTRQETYVYGLTDLKALLQARLEPRYEAIMKNTIGIIFFGTPHRGADIADYGSILANIASSVTNRPTSQLLTNLRANSDALSQLTSNFKHQMPRLKIVSFYETKPIKHLSSLVSVHRDMIDYFDSVLIPLQVVAKSSALLEVAMEDQIPCDRNHNDLCKFEKRDDPIYQKVTARINRILKEAGDRQVEELKSM